MELKLAETGTHTAFIPIYMHFTEQFVKEMHLCVIEYDAVAVR